MEQQEPQQIQPLRISYTGRVHVKLKPFAQVGPAASSPPGELAAKLGFHLVGPIVRSPSVGPAAPASGELSRWVTMVAPRPTGIGPASGEVSSREAVWEGVRRALQEPQVEWAEPDAIAEVPVPEAASISFRQPSVDDWHLRATNTYAAWAHLKERGKGRGKGVRVAHLDTGYTEHPVVVDLIKSKRLLHGLGRDFWRDRDGAAGALDPMPSGILVMPGHGTGTVCLLAADSTNAGRDYRGTAPEVEVLPIRISPSVVHVRTESMASGIRYAIEQGAHVITISMGGLPSQLWADALNDAYDAGIVVCAAAGNNLSFGPLRTPSRVVYPARFGRAVAVAGITQDNERYWLQVGMSGNYGRQVNVAAPTPDVMWAQAESHAGGIRYGYGPGGGTSTATPQVAGAAALWLGLHGQTMEQENFTPQERVEACRMALLRGAFDAGRHPYWYEGERTRNDYFGDGRLDVLATLKCLPTRHPAKPRDSVRGAFWGMLGIGPAAPVEGGADALALEIERLWAAHASGLEDFVQERYGVHLSARAREDVR